MNRCIAISGKSGCGNTSVSTELARRLNYRLVNYTMRDLAADMRVTLLDLLGRATQENWIDRELDQRQVRLAAEGNSVVGSRLAIWNLKSSAFTVYLRAPLEVRSQRIAVREGKTLEFAHQETIARDAADRIRFLELYGIDIDDYAAANLIIDVASHTVDQIVELITDNWLRQRPC